VRALYLPSLSILTSGAGADGLVVLDLAVGALAADVGVGLPAGVAALELDAGLDSCFKEHLRNMSLNILRPRITVLFCDPVKRPGFGPQRSQDIPNKSKKLYDNGNEMSLRFDGRTPFRECTLYSSTVA